MQKISHGNSTQCFNQLMKHYHWNYIMLSKILSNAKLNDEFNLQHRPYWMKINLIGKTPYTEVVNIKFGIIHRKNSFELLQFAVRLYNDTQQAEALLNLVGKIPTVTKRIINKIAPELIYKSYHNEKRYTNHTLYKIIHHFD